MAVVLTQRTLEILAFEKTFEVHLQRATFIMHSNLNSDIGIDALRQVKHVLIVFPNMVGLGRASEISYINATSEVRLPTPIYCKYAASASTSESWNIFC